MKENVFEWIENEFVRKKITWIKIIRKKSF